jgi:glutamine amidotransferase
MSGRVTIVDYGTGNAHTICRQLRAVGASVELTAEPSRIRDADKLVLPGVGNFHVAMEHLRGRALGDALAHAARTRCVPVLGICLGMQLMTRSSEEGRCDGLGWLDASVVAFRIRDPYRFRVPHMGWNVVTRRRASSRLLHGIGDGASYYFVHGYHLVTEDRALVVGDTEHESVFASVVEQDNLFGVQFHPEKSHDSGRRLLRNFVEL